jgi:ornithine decarboxylase
VKANPAPEILNLLERLGSSFDCASVAESKWFWRAGATPERISYGNTIKKERDIARAFELGVRSSPSTASKKSRRSPACARRARVLPRPVRRRRRRMAAVAQVRLRPQMAPDVLDHAHRLGLVAYGVSFHVGSQHANARSLGQGALSPCSGVFRQDGRAGITLKMVNMGGGFPTRYLKDVPGRRPMGKRSSRAAQAFRQPHPATIIEPGRGMVGNAGAIKAEVVLISRKSDAEDDDPLGLSRHRQVRRLGRNHGRGDPLSDPHRATAMPHDPCVLAGPTCDSVDVLYEKTPYELPVSLTIGDKVLIEACGAYTTTYSIAVLHLFNGFAPLLPSYVI